MSNYKDLLAWKESRALKDLVYETVQTFPREEIYCLSSQMRRAVVSIGSNIAEGAGRGSRRDYIHFLYIARGSAYEIETQTIYADDLHFLTPLQSDKLHTQISRVIYLLNRLIAALEDNINYQVKEDVSSYGSREIYPKNPKNLENPLYPEKPEQPITQEVIS